jgi:hypothetical protein
VAEGIPQVLDVAYDDVGETTSPEGTDEYQAGKGRRRTVKVSRI